MAYQIEILSTNADLYKHIERASSSLNKVQEEFEFRTPSQKLKDKLYLHRRERYKSEDVFQWLDNYRTEAKGHRPFIILVVDGFLESNRLSNLFGTVSAEAGLAVFTVNDFDQFVHDIVRYCRYYFVRYALSFVEPKVKSHDDTGRKTCMFHKKMNKAEIKYSLDSGFICDQCFDILRPRLTNDIKDSIDKLLLVVSNQHPFSIVIKGGGVKGLAFAGALLELENHFSFDTFAGTSAGAIASVLLGAGYKPQELIGILSNKDFNDFKDAGFFESIINLIRKKGLYPGDEIENWIKSLLKKKFPEKLNEVMLSDFEIHTIVYSSRIVDGTLIFDSRNQRRETHAAYATRCSMSIPYFFIPKEVDGIKVYDGGLRNNFPLKLFMETYPKKPAMGLYLVSGTKKGGLVIGDLTNIAIDGEEVSIVENNLDKVVVIDPRPIKTTDFNLTETKKEFLILSGRLGALKFIKRNYVDIEIDSSHIGSIEARLEELRKLL